MSTETLPGMGDAITAITFAWSLFYGSDLVLLPFRLFLEQKTRKTNGLETEKWIIYIYIYTVIFGFKMLVFGGAGGNLLLKTSTRTHKNQISPESHPRSVGSSWRWDLYQHFAEVLNGMFPSKKARTPTLEPPSNLQLILHHFRGKKHQMFGWKPPPSGRLFLGGFINLPQGLPGRKPAVAVRSFWLNNSRKRTKSGFRCSCMREDAWDVHVPELRGTKGRKKSSFNLVAEIPLSNVFHSLSRPHHRFHGCSGEFAERIL